MAKALQKLGYDTWYDEYSLKLGDSLTAEIDRGLIEYDYGVVIFSKSFFSKKWALNLADNGVIPAGLYYSSIITKDNAFISNLINYSSK